MMKYAKTRKDSEETMRMKTTTPAAILSAVTPSESKATLIDVSGCSLLNERLMTGVPEAGLASSRETTTVISQLVH